MKIHLIAAARPNFMKIAPLYHALKNELWAKPFIIHTGQHYDINMSDAFFDDLMLPEPDLHLGVGSGTHAQQTGKVMIAYEKVLIKEIPDLVVVVGDVNSTVAATLAAAKLGIRVAHLEAGLRSFDRTMPEEINRIATDALADMLWTPSLDADENLLREGVDRSRIVRVGNIMIDSFEMLRPKIESVSVYKDFRLSQGQYGVVTLHRPANVDSESKLRKLCNTLQNISMQLKLIFPVHPRTLKNLKVYGLIDTLAQNENILLTEPLSYISFMNLVLNCHLAITDSGGIQEETSYLGIPCFTLRPNTERPITVSQGTNRLCSVNNVLDAVRAVMTNTKRQKKNIDFWDGKTAKRVVSEIQNHIQ
ncbi:MAG: UDP-N-acetylglucosamine 2-epimerase (non-hydrolyzing) [Desulfatitalea sp.]|nr:UDP-N-acetylglucosamine 2-epimerase (non-hydrolyzing) [Desulfatitalea sp.]